VSLPCPHPSRALTLATPCTHSQPAARQAAQDGARAPRRVRRVGVLRSVHTRFVGRGRVAQALPRSRSGASIAPYTPHSHPAPTASTAPTPPHTPHTASSTSPPHLARLRPLQAARKEDGKLSYAHTRSASARCPSYQAQALLPPSCIRLRAALLTPLATSGHPVAQDQLDQVGKNRRDLLLLASRPVVLPHTRPAHRLTHA